MTLSEYLKKHYVGTPADFAREIGVARSTIWRLLKGERVLPRADLAKKISDGTGGKVTYKRRVGQTQAAE